MVILKTTNCTSYIYVNCDVSVTCIKFVQTSVVKKSIIEEVISLKKLVLTIYNEPTIGSCFMVIGS